MYLLLLLAVTSALPNNTAPVLNGVQIVVLEGYEPASIMLWGYYLQNTTNVYINNTRCAPAPNTAGGAAPGPGPYGPYDVHSAACRIQMNRTDGCLVRVKSKHGASVMKPCEEAVDPYTCYNYGWLYGYGSFSTPCDEITPADACTRIRCEYQQTSFVVYCIEYWFGHGISNAGLQCDYYGVCGSNNTCVDARGYECLSNVTCAPPASLAVGQYSVTLSTPLGNSTLAPGAFVVLPNPALLRVDTLSNSLAPPPADGSGAVVACGGADIFIGLQNDTASGVALVQYHTGGAAFLGVLPALAIAPPAAMWQYYNVTAEYYSQQYGQTFFATLPFSIQLVRTPTLFTLCPGVALAFTQTTIVIHGAFFWNSTQYLVCKFGEDTVPVVWVSDILVLCTVSSTNATARLVPITVSNDGGNVFASPVLQVSVLGSCGALKPNSVPAGAQCVCPVGFQDAGYACLPCPLGTYQPAAGQQACIPCDSATQTTLGVGNTDAAACVCTDGYYLSPSAPEGCLACPAGLACVNQAISTLPGYWRPSSRSLVATQCDGFPGSSAAACPGGSANMVACAAGYTGPVCTVCADGYGRLGGACVRCSGKGPDVVVLVVLLLAACVALYILIRMTTEHSAQLGVAGGSVTTVAKIFFSYAQILYYIGNLSVDWSRQSVTFFNVFIPMSLSPSFVAIQCATGWAFYEREILTMVLPLIIGAVLGVLFAFTAFALPAEWVIRHFTLSADSYMRCLLIILYVVHPMISHELLLGLKCISVPGLAGTFLQHDMAVSCATPSYRALSGILVLYILLYILGLPLAVGYRMYRCKKQLLGFLNNGWTDDNSHKYLYFARGFKDGVYLWEGAIMFRKLLVVTTSLISQPMIQLCWSGVIIVTSLIATVRLEPYRSPIDNNLDTIALAALWISILLGTHAVQYRAAAALPVFVFLVLVNCGAIAMMLSTSYVRLKRAALALRESARALVKSDSQGDGIKMYQRGGRSRAHLPPQPTAAPPPPPPKVQIPGWELETFEAHQ
jgi:hypothetical protein